MRVISGTAGGRRLKAVSGKGTRPTADKVKQAIFNAIGPYFDGGHALDLFAGTGALGIEALSRGCDMATLIDIEPKSIAVIQHNLQVAGFSKQANVYRTDAQRALKAMARRKAKVDLVFIDPPYRYTDGDILLQLLQEYAILENTAIAVLEYDAGVHYADSIGMLVADRETVYGDTMVKIYRMQK